MHYFTCRAKLNGKLKETAFFSQYSDISCLRYKRDGKRILWTCKFSRVASTFPCRSCGTRGNLDGIEHRVPSAIFFLQRIITERRRGTRREFRFALTYIQTFATTIARHMGLSSSRKFDVLTVSGRGRKRNIYRVTLSHMARDKNATLTVFQLARLREENARAKRDGPSNVS